MRRVLVGLILLILYGSLFPWHFSALPVNPVLVWPRVLDTSDVVVNLVLYIPVGACAFFAYALRGWKRLLFPVGISFALSMFVELAQVFVPTRVSELSDVLFNTVGGALGVLLAAALRKRPTAQTILVACWAAHLMSLRFEGWAAEIIGLLIVANLALPERTRRWGVWTAAACYAGVLIRGLRPFVFAHSTGPFFWVPFAGFLAYQSEYALGTLFAKIFWYGSAVWVLRRLGVAWWLAGAAAAMELGVIEVLQRRMPAHVAEITDPLIALLLAAAFWSISRDRAEVAA
jgi:glycopeptide antibiotics resistance protein